MLRAIETPGGYRSPAYREMAAWIACVAPSGLPVLIRGESGSGKELVSRTIHRLGRHPEGPFVGVNCAAFSESLLDAELFGVVRGAYTDAHADRPGLFRIADGGTLFLDEIGEMQPSMQAKLLRALQERTIRPVGGANDVIVDVRVISATHRDLLRRCEVDAFRSDLYYRLATLEVRVPPLRERPEDFDLLVDELAPRLERETGWGPPRITAAGWRALRGHAWPGNVRELHAVLARSLLRAAGSPIEPRHLGLPDAGPATPWNRTGAMEREMIALALERAAGNLAGAAARIGWTRQKLYRRMRALALERRGPGDEPCSDQPLPADASSSGNSTFQ